MENQGCRRFRGAVDLLHTELCPVVHTRRPEQDHPPCPGGAIEEFMFRAVAVGVPLQALLLITGAIWAQEAWTKAWSWDPKETWALITWLVYAAYLHVRVQRGVRGITMAWLSLI